MNIQPLVVLMVVAFALPSRVSTAHASHPPQAHRSNSDADIDLVGHRRIDHGPNLYTLQKESEIGKSLAAQVEQSAKLLNDPVVSGYVDRVAQKIAKESDAQIPITVTVLDGDDLNAVTFPGGYQYISRGLILRLESEAELAGVIARGIAHTALRSATTLATEAGITNISIVGVSTVPAGGSTPPDLVESLIARQSQADELNADYFGAQYMYKAGYDPKCVLSVVRRIGNPIPAASQQPYITIVASFPPVDERLANLQKEISKILPSRPNATVSTPEFDALKQRIRPQASELQR